MKVCRICEQKKDRTDFNENKRGAQGLQSYCKLCQGKRELVYRSQLREEMFEALGRACRCCGETFPPFLALDHVKGGGGAERRLRRDGTTGSGHGGGYRSWLRAKSEGWPKEKYQILCHNCNSAKAQGIECPCKSVYRG